MVFLVLICVEQHYFLNQCIFISYAWFVTGPNTYNHNRDDWQVSTMMNDRHFTICKSLMFCSTTLEPSGGFSV